MKQMNFTDLTFIGREKEMNFLRDRLDSAFSNHGHCLLLVGEQGIGKSRLIDEFLLHKNKGVVTLRISVEPRINKMRDLVSETIMVYLRGAVHSSRVITRVVDPAMYREFRQSIPELDIYYPFEMESAGLASERPDIKEMFFRFLNNVAAMAPVVLVIDNFDGSGEDGRALVEYLLPNISTMPLFLILAGQEQPDMQHWLDRVDSAAIEKRSLSRLSREEISQINRLLFSGSLDRDFMDWIADKTGGLPLFIKEFLFALFEKGVIFYESEYSRWRTIGSYHKIAIPERIDDLIRDRLKKLSEPEINFLETASVMGNEFDARLPVFRAAQKLIPSLVRAGFIQKKNGNYSFTNSLIRDMLYGGIPPDEKIKAHRALAEYFEENEDQGSAAEHYAAASIKNAKVLELFISSAGRFRQAGAYGLSILHLERALDIAGTQKNYPLSKSLDLHLELCTSLFLGEKYERVHELAPTVEKTAGKKQAGFYSSKLGVFYSQLIQSMIRLGKYEDALGVSRKALGILEHAGVKECNEARIEIATYQAFLHRDLGDLDQALALALGLKNTCEKAASALCRYNIYKLLGSVYNEKRDFMKAIGFREQALAAAKQTGIDHLIAAAQGNLGVSLTSAGLLVKGMEFMRMYQDYNVSAGRIRAEIVSYIHMAQIYFNQGYLAQAEAEYKKGIERSEKHGGFLKEAVCELHYRYGTFLVMAENYPGARRHLELSVKIAREMKNKASELYSLLNLGYTFAALKDKGGLSRIINEIRSNHRGKYEGEISFAVLEGFQSIFSTRIKAGLKKIDDALARLEQQQVTSGLFRLLYLCGTYLRSNKKTVKQADVYLKKARAIAEKYQMTGWLSKMTPDAHKPHPEPLRIYCLGPLRIEHPRKGPVNIDQLQRVKPAQLLTILICGILTKVRHTRERIGSLLWPDLTTAKMVNNFHVCLFQLKEHVGSEHVNHVNGNYVLEHAWLDALEFKGLINKGNVLLQEGKIHLAEQKFEEAFELYKGDFLEDAYDPWIDDVRNELKGLRNSRLLMLGEIYLKKLKFEQAIIIGQDVLKADALNEEGHRFLIKLYLLSGEKAKAVHQYKKCVELFRRELDCEPSEETRSLYSKIK
jgi:predicted ATPase/DNA-binding SARP family transcriptional activator